MAAIFGYSAERLQLTSLKYTQGAATLFHLSYGYTQGGGNNGQITSITDNVESGRTATYAYDALGRLQDAATAGSAAYPKWHYLYDYDRYGNLLAKNLQPDSVGTHPTLSISVSTTSNRITSAGFAYDASGNMTNDGQYSYTYDAENRAKTGAGAAYSYDGAGLRVKKVAGATTTRYIFSGTKVVAEYVNGAAVGSPTREYIYSGSALLATIEGSTTTYHHQDHLSARVNTDSSGTVVGQQGNYPFGESWYTTSSTTKWRFTSYERDAESGNDYAIFRYHSNRLGRFTTPDPLTGSIAEPQSLNRYAYVLNNAVNLIDPLGLDPSNTFLIEGGVSWIGDDCILDHLYVSCQMVEQLSSMGELTFEEAPPGWKAASPNGDYAGCFYVLGGARENRWCPGDPGGPSSPFNHMQEGNGDVGGGPTSGESLIEALKKALSNPKCAALVGGAKNAKQLLKELNLQDVTSPGFNEKAFPGFGDHIRDVRRGADIANTTNKIGAPIFVGTRFNNTAVSGQASIIIHEFRHQVGLNVPEASPGQKIKEFNRIRDACGTAFPSALLPH